jgi:hypothetical protein
MEGEEDLGFYEEKLRTRCRLITLALPLAGVMPNAQDYPFYLMKTPFRKTMSASDWIHAVLSKRATTEEFLSEIEHDPDFTQDKLMLKSLMKRRFNLTHLS